MRSFHDPIIEPQNGPKALCAHMTKPPLPGKVVASSAVIRPSGMLQIKGKIINPRIANRGPAAATAASSPLERSEMIFFYFFPGNKSTQQSTTICGTSSNHDY